MSETSELPAPETIAADFLERHDFTVDRGLCDYESLLGPEFRSILSRLNETHHWIDMGAGDVLAQEQFSCSLGDSTGSKQPYLTAVTYRLSNLRTRQLQRNRESLKIFADRKFESIDESEFRRADLITDVVGILTYTTDLSGTLQKYLDLLNSGGVLLIHLPASTAAIRLQNGQQCLFVDWLRSLTGLMVTEVDLGLSSVLERATVSIRKLNSTITIPRLSLISAFRAHALYRVFELK